MLIYVVVGLIRNEIYHIKVIIKYIKENSQCFSQLHEHFGGNLKV